jgi:hypothetical protein
MAIICRKPCFEVLPPPSRVFFLFPRHLIIIISNQIYIHRKVIFKDEKIPEIQQPEPPIKSAKKNFSKF